ncbi:MAG: hypothetical protein OXI81_18230, partial [Paracoccaceae bacterium]|nr:hypothetical protein [Paracoccaceae bacterium]
ARCSAERSTSVLSRISMITGIGRAVQAVAATRAILRTAPLRLLGVDALQERPDAGVGKHGTGEQNVRH